MPPDPFCHPFATLRNASWTSLGSASAIGNPWLFTGQEWRSDLGLSNYKARWYQPTLGRFMQNDPVRFDAGDINLYRYCGNNPINCSDPSGKIAWFVPLIGAGAGAIANGFQNYDALESGKMSKMEYAVSIATGAGYGALATLAPGPGSAVAVGAATGAANSVTNEALKGSANIGAKETAKNTVIGAASGLLTNVASKLARLVTTKADPNLPAKVGAVTNIATGVGVAALGQKEEIPVVVTEKTEPSPNASNAEPMFRLDFTPKQ